MQKKVFVFIITYNIASSITHCLDSLSKQTFQNFELLIFDNNSSDDTVVVIENYLEKNKQLNIKTKIIKNKKNLGFAKAVNVGLKKALANNKFYSALLLNPDTHFTENLLANGVLTLEGDKEIGAALPKILYPDGKIWWMGTKILSDRELLFSSNYSIVEHLNKRKVIKFHKDQILAIDALTGCAVFFRLTAVKKIGLFDEKYFMYAEDIDYSNRLKKAGYKIALFTNSAVFHEVQDRKMNFKVVRSSLRKYRIYLTSVGIYLLDNRPSYIFFIWLFKLPFVLIFNYSKRKKS